MKPDETRSLVATATAALNAVLRLFRRPHMADLLTLLLMAGIMLAIAAAAIVAMVLTAGEAQATPLTAGDRVQLVLENGEGFSGKYQIDLQGQIALPYAGAVKIAGMDAAQASQAVTQRLEAQGLFRPGAARTTMQVLWWAPLNVSVSGEVFNPGTQAVNMPASRDRTIERAEEIPGAYAPNRNLSDALKAAGGITTWADLSRVALRRGGLTTVHDVRHLLSGQPGIDPALQEGDELTVARLAQPEPLQARPSAITPPGIKVFAGNMVQSQNNAPAANALGALPMAYGSRLSQAVVAINCAGGINWSNASRMASLVRTERTTGQTRRWNVPVEKLLDEGSDEINPLLQEGDALACYDSQVTGWREVFKVLTDILSPISIFRGLP
jgi:polysaccharide biosynthesis/export protein